MQDMARRKRKSEARMLRQKSLIGLLSVLVILSLLATFHMMNSNHVVARAAKQFFIARTDDLFNLGRKEAYGKVETIGKGLLVLVTQRAGVTRIYHVRYNEDTRFYMFASDNELSEVELSPEDIQEGEYVSVTTERPISTQGSQEAISIIVM